MNRIYKVIWNAATQTWTVVSELARGHVKSKSNGTASTESNLLAISYSSLSSKAILSSALLSVSLFSGIAQAGITMSDSAGDGITATPVAGRAQASTNGSIAIGGGAKALGASGGIAVGVRANASQINSIAIGVSANVGTNNSVGIGTNTNVTGLNAIAIGALGQARGNSLQQHFG